MQKQGTPIYRQEGELLKSTLARNLGRKLRYLRAKRSWTQVELSRRVPISRAYLAKLERGNGGLPRYITLVRLADSLGVSLSELVSTEARADCKRSNEHQ
jgi:transcriptional regulator with XRE-family HTH domain